MGPRANRQALEFGDIHPDVVRLRRTAKTVGAMSGLDAEQSWRSTRRSLPWWHRLVTHEDAPDSYVSEFVLTERLRAREAFFRK